MAFIILILLYQQKEMQGNIVNMQDSKSITLKDNKKEPII